MARSFRELAPDRIEIRDGGGCVSLFGLPFLGAGLFVWLLLLGIVPTTNGDSLPWYGHGLLAVMGLVFATAGGVLVFGRSWTIVDASRRELVSERGLLVPLQRTVETLAGATEVSLSFKRGDSDTADEYPITVRTQDGRTLAIASFPDFPTAQGCAARLAVCLQLPLEDATGDRPQRLSGSLVAASFRERVRHSGMRPPAAEPPPLRTTVTREGDELRLRIPNPPMSPVAIVLSLVPLVLPLLFLAPLRLFFQQTKTPPAIGWAFIGFIALCFGVLPAASALGRWLRARFGATLVTVSRDTLVVEVRGSLRSISRTTVPVADILDVDISTRASTLAAAHVAADERVRELQRQHRRPAATSPLPGAITRFISQLATGRGIIVKSRHGVTTFAAGLPDDEQCYLHAVIWRALLD